MHFKGLGSNLFMKVMGEKYIKVSVCGCDLSAHVSALARVCARLRACGEREKDDKPVCCLK